MKKMRWFILILTAIICVAVYVNWDMVSGALKSGEKDKEAEKVLGEESFVSDSYFENARYTRQKTRDEAISVLNTVVSSADSDEDAKKTASEDINKYALASEKENVIETLVSSKGLGDCIAFVGTDNASIVIDSGDDGLSPAEAAQIIDIIVSETGLKTDVIKVIELSKEEGAQQ